MCSEHGVGQTVELIDHLDEMRPGPALATVLAELSQQELTAAQDVLVMRAAARMVAHYQSRVYRSMHRIWEHYDAGPDSDEPEADFAAAAQEIRPALRLTRRAAEQELSFAIDFFGRLPQLGDALARGVLDYRRARIYVHATSHLPDHVAQLVVAKTIDTAGRLTGGQLQAFLRYYCIKVEPETARQQYEEELTDRRVFSQPNPAGTATLMGLNLAPDRVEAALDRVNSLARSLRESGDPRTLDQLRADVFLDLLAGHSAEKAPKGRGMVELRVDLATLARLSEEPGELGGYGPIVAEIARRVAETQTDSQWRYTVTGSSGEIVVDGLTRRRPLARLRRHIEARTPTCIFPGCRRPAIQSDLDHRIAWSDGGPTQDDNLEPDCRHDHVIRHRAGWIYEPLPDGDYLWTSPLGHTYTTSGRPPPKAA